MNLKCRFDPTHRGPFSNAVVLQKHYVAAHSDVYEPPVRKQCGVPGCGKLVSNMEQHLRKKHGLTSGAELVPVPKAEPELPQWTADHIVLPVVTELAGGKKGTIPVAKLASVFRWRDATQQMLDEVQ